MAAIMTGFKPVEHGFKFINRFEFSAKFTLPLFGEVDLGNIVYGLCGGMCFAATDYYLLGRSRPEYADPDEIPDSYRHFLTDRQIASLGIVGVPRVIEWMLLDDLDVGKRTVRNEVPKLRRRLDKRQPTVLALIRTKSGESPTQNHQVLAVGYEEDPVTRLMTLYLYEPNYPGKEPTISLNLGHPSQGIDVRQSTGEPLRGFFVIPYRSQEPPQDERIGM